MLKHSERDENKGGNTQQNLSRLPKSQHVRIWDNLGFLEKKKSEGQMMCLWVLVSLGILTRSSAKGQTNGQQNDIGIVYSVPCYGRKRSPRMGTNLAILPMDDQNCGYGSPW